MGVDVVDEHPYEFPAAEPFWIYDFGLRRKPVFESAETAPHDDLDLRPEGQGAGRGRARRALERPHRRRRLQRPGAGRQLAWRQVNVLRAYAKYLRQAGTPFSQGYIERRAAVATRPSPGCWCGCSSPGSTRPAEAAGQERSEAHRARRSRSALDDVASLDEDRILRSYLGLIQATLRTNYYQLGLDGAPKPTCRSSSTRRRCPTCPRRGPIRDLRLLAPGRGRAPALRPRSPAAACAGPTGARTSAPRSSGLVKAQMVKNAVIVPVGAKGGFVVKHCPTRPTATPTWPR